MFKVNNKETRTTPLAICSNVPIVNFQQVKNDRVEIRYSDYFLIYNFCQYFFREPLS